MEKEVKFICDAMLGKLGRFLRFLGYDTLIVDEKIKDEEIVKIAKKEGRILLTRDKEFEKWKKEYDKIIIIKANSLDEQFKELCKKIKIDLEPKAVRCSLCNTPLIEVKNKEELKGKVPEKVLERFDEFWFCPNCKKYYWPGSHWDNIEKFFERVRKSNQQL